MNISITKRDLQINLRLIEKDLAAVETKRAELIHQANSIRSVIDMMDMSSGESDGRRR